MARRNVDDFIDLFGASSPLWAAWVVWARASAVISCRSRYRDHSYSPKVTVDESRFQADVSTSRIPPMPPLFFGYLGESDYFGANVPRI